MYGTCTHFILTACKVGTVTPLYKNMKGPGLRRLPGQHFLRAETGHGTQTCAPKGECARNSLLTGTSVSGQAVWGSSENWGAQEGFWESDTC